MRPTYSNIVAVLRSIPEWPRIYRQTGYTPEKAAAEAMSWMQKAPTPAARDKIFSDVMAAAGIATSGVEAFDKGTEAIFKDVGNRPAMDRTAQRMSEQSRNSPLGYSSPERVKQVLTAAYQSSGIQGVADRFRASDAHRERHESKVNENTPAMRRLREAGDDRKDLRSALSSASLSQPFSRGVLKIDGEHENVRDTLRAAFDVVEEVDHYADPMREPLLMNLSDAV